MAAPTVQNCHTMTSYFEKLYKARYGRAATTNRVKARWSWDAILRGMDMDEAKALLEYYLTLDPPKGHDLQWFFNNYETLIENKQQAEADRARIRRLRAESQARAEAWKERIGKQRTSTD